MHAKPMPARVTSQLGAMGTVVIGEDMNPADPHAPNPAEYAITRSVLYPGRPCYTVLVGMTDEERAAIGAGADLLLTLDGAEMPWMLTVDDG